MSCKSGQFGTAENAKGTKKPCSYVLFAFSVVILLHSILNVPSRCLVS